MSNGGSAAGAVRLWARSELGRRWRALVALGIIAGLAGGLALAAMAGARRTSTAYGRWRAATAAPDAIVFGTQIGKNDTDYTPVLELPEVEDCHSVAGDENYILKVRTRTTADLEDFLRRLREKAGVHTRTTVVLSTPFEHRPISS